MFDWLWLIPAFPLLGFLILTALGSRIPRRASAVIGTASVGASSIWTIATAVAYFHALPLQASHAQALYDWINIAGFSPKIGFYLDSLSLLMAFVVTFVAFWIHLYSTEFMIDDDAYGRFFAYMNLFVASMLILVLADNLLFLYLGWEGVGLCSFLLIGFWRKDPANGRAAQKAFIVTRIGDTAMAIGLFLLFYNIGTLDIQAILAKAPAVWAVGSGIAIAVAALLLGGAMGKSAQLPLQTWLPDAMAGPTPVSALIHAATMVTAGVYLIARMHGLFLLAPPVMTATAIIGAATLFIAGSAALVQSDIKRILAYSTISQLGYMFLALGVGAWSAAMFHFMTHAFFKALLFLGAGVVIHCLHHEHDIYKMGGLKKRLPATFWVFLAGGASLAGLPLVTAGFYSKDLILWQAWSSNRGSSLLWIVGIATAFMTALYTFRLIFIVFFGTEKTHVEKRPGIPMLLPLIILAVLSILAGFIETPPALGNIKWFSAFINSSLPAEMEAHASPGAEIILGLVAAILAIAGIYLAYVLYVRKRIHETAGQQAEANPLGQFLKSGWGFDKAYDAVLVQPFIRIAAFGKNDFVDNIYSGIAALFRGLNVLFSATETGRLRFYVAGIVLGTIIFVAIALFI